MPGLTVQTSGIFINMHIDCRPQIMGRSTGLRLCCTEACLRLSDKYCATVVSLNTVAVILQLIANFDLEKSDRLTSS